MARYKRLKSIREYMYDKGEMIEQMFSSIPIVEIKNMVPMKLQGMPLHELKAECLMELLGMSDREITNVLDGRKNVELPSSESETEEVFVISDEEIRNDNKKKKVKIEKHVVAINVDSDASSSGRISTSKKKKRKTKEVSLGNTKKRKVANLPAPLPSCSKDWPLVKDSPKKKKRSKPPKEKSKAKDDDVVILDVISSDEEEVKGEQKSLLDLLELEMRARAIRSLLKKDEEAQAQKRLNEYKDEPDDLIAVEVEPPQIELLSDSDIDMVENEAQNIQTSNLPLPRGDDSLSKKDAQVLDSLLGIGDKGDTSSLGDIADSFEVDEAANEPNGNDKCCNISESNVRTSSTANEEGSKTIETVPTQEMTRSNIGDIITNIDIKVEEEEDEQESPLSSTTAHNKQGQDSDTFKVKHISSYRDAPGVQEENTKNLSSGDVAIDAVIGSELELKNALATSDGQSEKTEPKQKNKLSDASVTENEYADESISDITFDPLVLYKEGKTKVSSTGSEPTTTKYISKDIGLQSRSSSLGSREAVDMKALPEESLINVSAFHKINRATLPDIIENSPMETTDSGECAPNHEICILNPPNPSDNISNFAEHKISAEGPRNIEEIAVDECEEHRVHATDSTRHHELYVAELGTGDDHQISFEEEVLDYDYDPTSIEGKSLGSDTTSIVSRVHSSSDLNIENIAVQTNETVDATDEDTGRNCDVYVAEKIDDSMCNEKCDNKDLEDPRFNPTTVVGMLEGEVDMPVAQELTMNSPLFVEAKQLFSDDGGSSDFVDDKNLPCGIMPAIQESNSSLSAGAQKGFLCDSSEEDSHPDENIQANIDGNNRICVNSVALNAGCSLSVTQNQANSETKFPDGDVPEDFSSQVDRRVGKDENYFSRDSSIIYDEIKASNRESGESVPESKPIFLEDDVPDDCTNDGCCQDRVCDRENNQSCGNSMISADDGSGPVLEEDYEMHESPEIITSNEGPNEWEPESKNIFLGDDTPEVCAGVESRPVEELENDCRCDNSLVSEEVNELHRTQEEKMFNEDMKKCDRESKFGVLEGDVSKYSTGKTGCYVDELNDDYRCEKSLSLNQDCSGSALKKTNETKPRKQAPYESDAGSNLSFLGGDQAKNRITDDSFSIDEVEHDQTCKEQRTAEQEILDLKINERIIEPASSSINDCFIDPIGKEDASRNFSDIDLTSDPIDKTLERYPPPLLNEIEQVFLGDRSVIEQKSRNEENGVFDECIVLVSSDEEVGSSDENVSCNDVNRSEQIQTEPMQVQRIRSVGSPTIEVSRSESNEHSSLQHQQNISEGNFRIDFHQDSTLDNTSIEKVYNIESSDDETSSFHKTVPSDTKIESQSLTLESRKTSSAIAIPSNSVLNQTISSNTDKNEVCCNDQVVNLIDEDYPSRVEMRENDGECSCAVHDDLKGNISEEFDQSVNIISNNLCCNSTYNDVNAIESGTEKEIGSNGNAVASEMISGQQIGKERNISDVVIDISDGEEEPTANLCANENVDEEMVSQSLSVPSNNDDYDEIVDILSVSANNGEGSEFVVKNGCVEHSGDKIVNIDSSDCEEDSIHDEEEEGEIFDDSIVEISDEDALECNVGSRTKENALLSVQEQPKSGESEGSERKVVDRSKRMFDKKRLKKKRKQRIQSLESDGSSSKTRKRENITQGLEQLEINSIGSDTIIIEDDEEDNPRNLNGTEEAKTNWTTRWLESSNVKDVVRTSKILTNARKKMKFKLKTKEVPTAEPSQTPAETPQLIGSIEEYHRLVRGGVITASQVESADTLEKETKVVEEAETISNEPPTNLRPSPSVTIAESKKPAVEILSNHCEEMASKLTENGLSPSVSSSIDESRISLESERENESIACKTPPVTDQLELRQSQNTYIPSGNDNDSCTSELEEGEIVDDAPPINPVSNKNGSTYPIDNSVKRLYDTLSPNQVIDPLMKQLNKLRSSKRESMKNIRKFESRAQNRTASTQTAKLSTIPSYDNSAPTCSGSFQTSESNNSRTSSHFSTAQSFRTATSQTVQTSSIIQCAVSTGSLAISESNRSIGQSTVQPSILHSSTTSGNVSTSVESNVIASSQSTQHSFTVGFGPLQETTSTSIAQPPPITTGHVTPSMVSHTAGIQGVHPAMNPISASAEMSNTHSAPCGLTNPQMSVNVNSTLNTYDPYYNWVYSQGLSGSMSSNYGYGTSDHLTQDHSAIYKQWEEYYRKMMEACQVSAVRASASGVFDGQSASTPNSSNDKRGYSWVFERPASPDSSRINTANHGDGVVNNVGSVENRVSGKDTFDQWKYRFGLKGLLNEHFTPPQNPGN